MSKHTQTEIQQTQSPYGVGIKRSQLATKEQMAVSPGVGDHTAQTISRTATTLLIPRYVISSRTLKYFIEKQCCFCEDRFGFLEVELIAPKGMSSACSLISENHGLMDCSVHVRSIIGEQEQRRVITVAAYTWATCETPACTLRKDSIMVG